MGDWLNNGDGTSSFTTNGGEIITISNSLLSNGGGHGMTIGDITRIHPDYHEYSNFTNLGYNTQQVSSFVANGAFQINPTLFGPDFAGLGFVQHFSPNSNTIVNATTNVHALDPGVVQRELVVIDGQYYVKTIGVGTGIKPGANVALAGAFWTQTDVNIMQHIFAVTGIAPNPHQAGRIQSLPEHCFLAGTMISMWPLEPHIVPDANGNYDEAEVLKHIWHKPIEKVTTSEWVVSPDKEGRLKPGRVKRTMQNEVKIILDFYGTYVTPGHVYYSPETEEGGQFEGGFAPLIDILRADGIIQKEDGTLICAATNCVVGSEDDEQLWAFTVYEDEKNRPRAH